VRALVLSGINNIFTAQTAEGELYECRIKGKILRETEGFYNALAPGDVVEIESDPHEGGSKAQVLSLEQRRGSFARWNEKGRSLQVLAANLDLVVCVTSANMPPFRPRFIDRVLVMAELAGLPALVVMNKVDQGRDDEAEERLDDYERLGYEVARVSARTGKGIDWLRKRLSKGLSVMTGQSGVGKSSLLNALDPDLNRRVGEVSAKFERGTHTTNFSQLLGIRGASLWDGERARGIVDTPGVRRLALKGIPSAELGHYLPEFRALIGSCSFGASCSHVSEPGCKILEAVYSGVIHEDRYESYLRMREELDERDAY
jgi:ribosome biogenesis GTPase / thiamine phosphate phosphatase